MSCIEQLRAVIDEYDGRLLCGEVQGKTDRIGHFYRNDAPRMHLPLNFALLDAQWDALSLQANIDSYQNALPDGAWPDWVIGGHDKPRIASRIGQAQARIAAMLLLTLRGTPFFFAGDELGAEQVPIPPECVRDPFAKLVKGFDLGRDPERSPMRWDSTETGGFTSGTPWLPMDNHRSRNVEQQMKEPKSLLHLYRALIELRKREPALTDGDFEPVRSHNDILCYRRIRGEERLFIGLNISPEPRRWEWQGRGLRLLSTNLDGGEEPIEGPVQLRGGEGLIVRLE
jgi:alpha-glucosidase